MWGLAAADVLIVFDNGKKAVVRLLEDYLNASAAIDVCVVLCPAQTHLVAAVSAATYLSSLEVREEAVGGGA